MSQALPEDGTVTHCTYVREFGALLEVNQGVSNVMWLSDEHFDVDGFINNKMSNFGPQRTEVLPTYFIQRELQYGVHIKHQNIQSHVHQ
jgi:hypothetical protein